MIIGANDLLAMECPHCHQTIYLAGDDEFPLEFECPLCSEVIHRNPLQNVSYPKTFDLNDGVYVSDEEITEVVRMLAKRLLLDDEEHCFYWMSGDTLVLAIKDDERSISVAVARNYQMTSIWLKPYMAKNIPDRVYS